MRAFFLSLLLAGAVLFPHRSAAQEVDEYAVRVAFIYNVTAFVEWPSAAFGTADSPFIVCVLGHDAFGARLGALEQRRAGTRAIRVEYPRNASSLSRCQIAYFGTGSPTRLVGAAQGGRLPNVLTMSSDPTFAKDGGLVSLVARGKRIRVHVNLEAIDRSSLHFSAKLLELARVRHDARRSGDDA